MAKLPAYVYADKDRHGRVRYRFRKKGLPSKTIQGDPSSKEFRDHYNAAFGDVESNAPPPPKNSFAWLSGEYLFHLGKMVTTGRAGAATLRQRQNILKNMLEDYGDRDAFSITPKAVRFIIGQKAATPGAANNTLKTLRAMYIWAVDSGMIDIDPTLGVKRLQYKTEGFTPWSMANLRTFTQHHPAGSKPYLTALLALCTGARRGDLCKLGPKNLSETNGIKFITYTQEKGGKQVTVPIMPILLEAIELIDTPNMLTFLPTKHGRIHSKEGFGTWFAKQVNASGLSGISLHGLRKAQGALLAEMGCTQYEIMAVQGHSSPKSSEIYTRSASHMKLAIAAMGKVSNFKV